MIYVLFKNGAQQTDKPRLAHHTERKGAVVVMSRRSLCHQGDFELGRAVQIAQSGEPAGERLNDRLNATDAGGKKVRINQQPHFRSISVPYGKYHLRWFFRTKTNQP